MKRHETIVTLISCVLAMIAMTDLAAAAQPPEREQRSEFDRQFLRMCDLAAAELEKPITPFADRKSTDASSHHMPFFEDAHAVRALCVAYDRTGELKYLTACQRWSDQMVAFQERMIPAGAYYMNHSRAPGQDRGEWNVADSGSIAMGVLATAVRCAKCDPRRYETYLRSVKTFAKLVMENYIGPEGGICNGLWSGYAGQWWCSTATAGSLLLLLHDETGDERYLPAGRAALEWTVRQGFRQVKPINFQQRPSGIVFYCFELYAIGLRRLAPDGPSYQLAQGQLAEAVAWMNEHPIKQAPGDWETFDIHTDMAGLPYLKFIFAREFSQYRQLSTTADEDLARISAWLFSRGAPPVSRLIPWEVMSWGMLSFAERLSPGLLFRASRQPADLKAQSPAEASASTTAPNSSAEGAIDGDRFAIKPGTFWKGSGGAKTWWWQLRFAEPRPVGAILQVHGDQPSILASAPSRYRWQSSLDGRTWQDLQETEVRKERRLYRVHRLVDACQATYLRLMIDECLGEAPSLREARRPAGTAARGPVKQACWQRWPK